MLKNLKTKDLNVVVIDILFLFLFALVLSVVIRTNVVFRVEKPLVLGGANKKQCGVRVSFFVCSAAGSENFQHW